MMLEQPLNLWPDGIISHYAQNNFTSLLQKSYCSSQPTSEMQHYFGTKENKNCTLAEWFKFVGFFFTFEINFCI